MNPYPVYDPGATFAWILRGQAHAGTINDYAASVGGMFYDHAKAQPRALDVVMQSTLMVATDAGWRRTTIRSEHDHEENGYRSVLWTVLQDGQPINAFWTSYPLALERTTA